MQLAVLNPGGNDREQAFPQGAATPDAPAAHAPVNYHAYAACTRGTFYREAGRIPAEQEAVLLVVRRDMKECLRALRELKAGGRRRVAMTLKESGQHQVAQLLETGENVRLLRELCAEADGCVASTEDLAPLYEWAGGKRVRFIPTPYPVEAAEWDFARPWGERAGVMIGTREWDTPSRNHAAALLLAGRLGGAVTVVNEDGRAGRRRLEGAGIGELRVIEGRQPYAEYLRLMAGHRLVLQLDRSAVPGQVAGDALLCGVPCVGGDGAIERIAFPDLCGHGRGGRELEEIARGLLGDEEANGAAVRCARERARARVGFEAVARELGEYFAQL